MSSVFNDAAELHADDFAKFELAIQGGGARSESDEVNENESGAEGDESSAGIGSDSETEQDLEPEAEGGEAAGEGDGEGEDEGEGDEDEKQPEAPKKKKGGFQKRIDSLTSRARELEEENQRLRERAEATKSGDKPAADVVKRDEATGRPVRPMLADFPTFEDHEKALAVYEDQLSDWKYESRRNAERAAETKQAAEKVWTDRESKTRAKHSDYDAKLQALQIPKTPAVDAVRTAIGESEVGPDLLYHLASNPHEAKRIVTLSPTRAVVELGKLEAKLTATKEAPKPKTREVSKAPDPVTPLRRGGKPAHSLGDPDQTYSDFEMQANQKLRRQR